MELNSTPAELSGVASRRAVKSYRVNGKDTCFAVGGNRTSELYTVRVRRTITNRATSERSFIKFKQVGNSFPANRERGVISVYTKTNNRVRKDIPSIAKQLIF